MQETAAARAAVLSFWKTFFRDRYFKIRQGNSRGRQPALNGITSPPYPLLCKGRGAQSEDFFDSLKPPAVPAAFWAFLCIISVSDPPSPSEEQRQH